MPGSDACAPARRQAPKAARDAQGGLVTGSEKSPPAGLTAPMIDTAPSSPFKS